MFKRRHKFGAIKAHTSTGILVGSKLEKAVHEILLGRQASGEIEIVKMQDRIELNPQPGKIDYIADFLCKFTTNQEFFNVEAKGMNTDVWSLKKRLYKTNGPRLLEIYTGNHSNPRLTETIKPTQTNYLTISGALCVHCGANPYV